MAYEGDFDSGISNQPKSHRGTWLIVFGVVFFLLLVFLFVFYSYSSTHISKRELNKGKNFDFQDNDSMKLKFEGEKHSVNVSIVGANSVDITIFSEPVKKRVQINTSVFFDLNNDSKNELRVWLKTIENGEAILEFKRIDGWHCVPSWGCDKWGDCIDGLRKRECIDVNYCGKPEESPVAERFCASTFSGDVSEEQDISDLTEEASLNNSENYFGDGELTCLENSGTICTDGQKCDGAWINSSDSLRCCDESCYSVEVDLIDSNNSITCDKSLNDFREAVFNCTSFHMECVQKILLSELGIVQSFDTIFEIQGYSGIDCILYYGYEDVFINYSNEKFQDLIDEGQTLPQINFALESLENNFVGNYENKSMTCYYPQTEFLIFARAWEDGRTTWSEDILGKYDCEGSLRE